MRIMSSREHFTHGVNRILKLPTHLETQLTLRKRGALVYSSIRFLVRLPSTGKSLPLCNFNLRARKVFQKSERSLAYYNPFKRLIIVTMSVPHHNSLQSYLVPHSLTSHNCNKILRIIANKYCEQARKQERRRASKQQFRYLRETLRKIYVTRQLKILFVP